MKRGLAEGEAQPWKHAPGNHPWRKAAVPSWRRRVNRQAREVARAIAQMRGQ